MPITYRIDRPRELVRVTCSGPVTFEEVMTHFAVVEADPDRVGELDVLLDLRGVTSNAETRQLREVAERMSPARTTLQYRRCALVAVDPAVVGMGRLFVEFARGRFRATTVVPTVEAAERWLC